MKVTKTYVSQLHTHVRYHLYAPDLLLRNKGVVQIHHGLGEHADLYDSFANFLVSKGFVVVVSDTVGHGRSLVDFEQGFFGQKDVFNLLVEDMRHLVDIIRKTYDDIPYFLLGYDLGSTLVRKFASVYGDYVDGIVLLSPTYKVRDLTMKRLSLNLMNAIYGPMHKSKFFLKKNNARRNKILNIKDNGFKWLTSDKEHRRAYIEDPMTHFAYTVKGYKDIISMIEEVNKDYIYHQTSKHLTIYIASGLDDPMIYKPQIIVEKYKKEGLEVTYKAYEKRRHALLLEKNRQEIYYDIYNWLNEHSYI